MSATRDSQEWMGEPVDDEHGAAWLARVERELEQPWSRWETLTDLAGGDEPADRLARIADAEALMTQLLLGQAREIAALKAQRLAEQAAAHGPEPVAGAVDDDGWVPSEVGWLLGLSEAQVRRRLAWVESLGRYPLLLGLVQRGGLPAWTAQKLVEHLDVLARLVSAERLHRIEAAVVSWLRARPRTVAALNQRMRRILLQVRAQAGADDGDGRGHAERRVAITPGDDGCAELWARLPEPDALAVAAALDAATRAAVDGDVRTRMQRRADALVAGLTGAPALYGRAEDVPEGRAGAGVEVRVEVTIPVATLTGVGSEPAEVPGYGPISPATARVLAEHPDAAAHGALYDAGSGRLLGLSAGCDLGAIAWAGDAAPASGYPFPPRLERLLRARDRTCRAPGCRRAARRCDCDHAEPWPTGRTSVDNGCCLCRYHHRLKTHAAGWSVHLDDDADLTWTTPTGRQHSTSAHDHRPPVEHSYGPEPPPF